MEAIFQSSTFGYENFSKLPISQSHKNFLRKLLKTSKLLHPSNPPLLVTQSYENFLQKLLKTSYENFLPKLPILHFSLRKLPIPPLLVTKPLKLLKTFYENSFRKLPIPPLLVTKT